ncbi:hypothetical protein D3Z50_19895 [Clostridiaceae bacterium]|nr:hypothetical protein [Clostridiaceae bacterium]
MEKREIYSDMPPQTFMQDGYEYLGEDGQWHIKDDAPEWAKKEFDEFNAMINPIPDEDGLIIQG